ncbi:MAG: sugar ABC transporter substrate-binding protein, partial [Arthrobacter oryzae]
MKKISWRQAALVASVVPMLALGACSSTGGKAPEAGGGGAAGQAVSTPKIKVAMVTHAGPGDTFWDIVRRGAEEAAAKD